MTVTFPSSPIFNTLSKISGRLINSNSSPSGSSALISPITAPAIGFSANNNSVIKSDGNSLSVSHSSPMPSPSLSD